MGENLSPSIYGSFAYKDKSYPFFLLNRRVYIVGEALRYHEDFKDTTEEEFIHGVTADNRQILFLRCKFSFISVRQSVSFFPAGYILSSGNIGAPYNFTFDRVSFYSDALNAFYPPQKAMISHVDVRDWDGSMKIELKPFEDTDVSFAYKTCKCKLNISRYVTLLGSQSNIGNINSAFSFEFDSTHSANKKLLTG